MRLMNRMFCVFALVTLAGCSPGTTDLEDRISEIKSRKAAPLEPLPVMKQFETFEYAAQDLRDPFSEPTEERVSGQGAGPRPDPERRKEALEAFPLDGLAMVGTLDKDGVNWGLVKDPDGVIHRVLPGNYVGQSDGKIAGIFEDRIELVELVPDGAGGWIERRAIMALGE